MATIFDGYNKAPDEQIAEQIAIIHTINFDNFLDLYINKVKKIPCYMINSIKRMFNKNSSVKDEKVKEIYEIIQDKKNRLKNFSRTELNKKLRAILCEKSNLSAKASDDMISIRIISESAKLFNINVDLTPCEKADRIYEKIHEINLKKIINNIDLSIKTYIAFIIVFIMILPIICHNASSSLGAFMIIVFSCLTVLGIGFWNITLKSKKIHKEMLAYSVYFAVKCYGKLFTPRNEELPSWALKLKYNEAEEENEKFIDMFKQKQAVSEELEKYEKKIISLKKQLEEQRNAIEKENNKCFIIEINKKDLQYDKLKLYNEKLVLYERLKKTEDEVKEKSIKSRAILPELANRLETEKKEIKMKIQQLEDIKNKLEKINQTINYSSNQIEIHEANINTIVKNLKTLEEKCNELKGKEENLKNDLNEKEKDNIEDLNNLWKIYFPKFQFEKDVFYNIVKLNFKYRLRIEKLLTQLHEANDPKALANMEKDNNLYGIRVILYKNLYAKIRYEIINDFNYSVRLLKIWV